MRVGEKRARGVRIHGWTGSARVMESLIAHDKSFSAMCQSSRVLLYGPTRRRLTHSFHMHNTVLWLFPALLPTIIEWDILRDRVFVLTVKLLPIWSC